MNKYVVVFDKAPYESIKNVYGFTLQTIKFTPEQDPYGNDKSYIEFDTTDKNFDLWQCEMIHGTSRFHGVDANLLVYDKDENLQRKYVLHNALLTSVDGCMMSKRSNERHYIVKFTFDDLELVYSNDCKECDNEQPDLNEIKAACKLFKTIEKYASETIPLISDLNLDDDDLLYETFTSEFNRNIDKQKEVLTKRIIELIYNLE
jgi:hypothetical protein